MKECGVYQIQCLVSGKRYIGSSVRVFRRWTEHRRQLRLGIHRSPRLQRAWNKHGEGNFAFSMLEECDRAQLFAREQAHIDALKPDYNSMPKVTVITREMRAKMDAALHARAVLITHCPKGHEYTKENTSVSRRGARLCRACNAERVARIYTSETPEQREGRRQRAAAYHELNREARLAKQRAYTSLTKEQKRAYDVAYRSRKLELRLLRLAKETSEQRQSRLERKRQSYLRHRESNLLKMCARYARTRADAA